MERNKSSHNPNMKTQNDKNDYVGIKSPIYLSEILKFKCFFKMDIIYISEKFEGLASII